MKYLLILFVSVSLTVTGQPTEATTNDGEKVVLNDDGTWKYLESPKDEKASSDCSKYISVNVDKMTGKTSKSTKSNLVVSSDGGVKGFGFLLMKSSGSIIFSIDVAGAGNCIDDEDKMNVLFRDGTKLELSSDGKFNCKRKYSQYFLGAFGKKKQFEMFRTKEVETIRIWTSDGYVEEDFTIEQSQELIMTINCLIN